MTIHLDPTERRVVGSLIEKEATVPDAYPLTLNALVLACNQKSNRDPETHLSEHEVVGAVQALMDRGWASEMELAGARTRRYAHRAPEQLGVEAADLALLAELLLRGPQSAGELSRRAARMRPVGGEADVEARLAALAARPVPYVRCLGRRPGERVARWADLLTATPADAVEAAAEGSAGPAPATAPAAPAPREAPTADLVARLEALERQMAEVLARLGPPPVSGA